MIVLPLSFIEMLQPLTHFSTQIYKPSYQILVLQHFLMLNLRITPPLEALVATLLQVMCTALEWWHWKQ